MIKVLYQKVVLRELRAKLLIGQLNCIPTLPYGQELWGVTKRVRLRTQTNEISFFLGFGGKLNYFLVILDGFVPDCSSEEGAEPHVATIAMCFGE